MLPDDPQLRARYQSAIRWARQAGAHTLNHFQRDTYQVSCKTDGSPVTQADRETEQLLRRLIKAEYPGDGIVGEEFGEEAGTTPFRWIVDPIDGTKSFIGGVPLYGTLVAVQYEQRSVIGVIEIPGLHERVYAAAGCGAWHVRCDDAPRPARVSTASSLSDGILLTSDIQGFVEREAGAAWQKLEDASWYARTWGDCYGYLLVATGRAVVMIDPQLNLWDAAAVQIVIEEAGGRFTDWQGRPRIDSGDAIATTAGVIDEILSITRTVPPQSGPKR